MGQATHMNLAHGSSHSHELSTWVKPLTWTKKAAIWRLFMWIRNPRSKSVLLKVWHALAYALKSLSSKPGHTVGHGSQNFASLASFQSWMVLSTLSMMSLHKKMRKPVRSQKDYKSYTKFRTGEGMMMAQTVAEFGTRFKAWRGPWTTVCDRPQSR